jgi:hypothetical protein
MSVTAKETVPAENRRERSPKSDSIHPAAGEHATGEKNKYSKLLKVIKVEQDRAAYGEFYDWGYWSGTSWAGHYDLPPGYWVYVAPNWHIFGKANGVEPGDNPPIRQQSKYRKLLRKIKVPEDAASYGEYHDYGYSSMASYRDFTDLPPGYWLYVKPHWCIFGEAPSGSSNTTPRTTAKPNWSPAQATGPPDTPQPGDKPTAWASRTADGQEEWLRLRYAKAVVPTAVHIYETYNPGAVCRITARKPTGEEVEIWRGTDPVSRESGKGRAAIALDADFPTNCITVYLNSKGVPGWNEIDAVGLLDESEQTQWAVSAKASSSWATPAADPTQSKREEIRQLEARIKELRSEVRQLEARVGKLTRRLNQAEAKARKSETRR